jgi:Uma2 family endonuclease
VDETAAGMGSPQRSWLGEADYLALEERATVRHEYVAGIAYAMAGAGERHNRIALNLAVALRAAARGTACGVYISDMKLRLDAGPAFYYPDVMLSCEAAQPDTLFKTAPQLLAEVLSPSTAAIDTREKLQAYLGLASLRYYLMIDSERPAVSYYLRGPAGDWLLGTLEPGDQLEVECGPVRTALSLAGLYEDTGLSVA